MSSTRIKIPSGKQLRITRGDTPITDVPIVLEEDITLSLSSSFSPLMGGEGNKLATLLGGAMKNLLNFGFSGQFKEMGYQIWTNTDPISFVANVSFYMGQTMGEFHNNAEEEVYKPAIALAKLPLPSQAERGEGIGLIPPGPSILTVLGKEEFDSGEIIAVQIGNLLYLDNALIRKAEPTFSNETDSNGFPIWAKVNLEIISVYSAYTQLLDQRGEGESSAGG